MRFFLLMVVCGVLCAGSARGAEPITLQAAACFSGMAPRGIYPVVVSIHNWGPSVDGAIAIKSDSFTGSNHRYLYPISLPSGTIKKVVVYPLVEQYAQNLTISFSGPVRISDLKIPIVTRSNASRQIGLIGDQIGGLAVLAQKEALSHPPTDEDQNTARWSLYDDSYARPEDAPDRVVGYQALTVLVLSDGAERMNPAQWSAIRHWVMAGGSLVMLGGAGAAYLNVPDAAAVAPVQRVQGYAVHGIQLPDNILKTLPPGDLSIVAGAVGSGAAALSEQDGHILLARQRLGAGTVLFAAFNPLDKPFRGWEGQKNLWNWLIRRATPSVDSSSLNLLAAMTDSFNGPSSYAGRGGMRRGVTQVNPFHVHLPPFNMVVWIFIAYFVLVIPISYLILKRLKRLEWAWVTSPLLSVAFAFIFYLFAADLYKAGMSKRTSGIIVASAGDRNARFAGFSEVFLPRGGSYKVLVPDAEMLELNSPYDTEYHYSGFGSQSHSLETVDLGTVFAPDFRVGNLTFERLFYAGPVTLDGTITADLKSDSGGHLVGDVRNGTGHALVDAFIAVPGHREYADIPDLGPGETKHVGNPVSFLWPSDDRGIHVKVTPAERSAANQKWQNEYQELAARSSILPRIMRVEAGESRAASAIFVAKMNGGDFGPPLGRDVGDDRSVNVLVSMPITGKNQ